MFVNCLPLVVVFRMRQAIGSGERLCGFVGFESKVALLVSRSLLVVADTAIAEHEVVVRLQILGIDNDGLLQLVNCLLIFVLKEEDAADVVADNAILGILLRRETQML